MTASLTYALLIYSTWDGIMTGAMFMVVFGVIIVALMVAAMTGQER